MQGACVMPNRQRMHVSLTAYCCRTSCSYMCSGSPKLDYHSWFGLLRSLHDLGLSLECPDEVALITVGLFSRGRFYGALLHVSIASSEAVLCSIVPNKESMLSKCNSTATTTILQTFIVHCAPIRSRIAIQPCCFDEQQVKSCDF